MPNIAYANDMISKDSHIVKVNTNFNETILNKSSIIADNDASLMHIIGNDDRFRVNNTMSNPYNNIVNITSYDARDKDYTENSSSVFDAHHKTVHSWDCSGVLLSDKVVLTAGHCINDPYDGTTSINKTQFIRGDFIVSPARNGGGMDSWNNPDYKNNPSAYPRGVYETTQAWYDDRWISTGERQYDWGILFLKTPVKNFNNEFKYGKLWLFDNKNNLSLTGYPRNTAENPYDESKHTMWSSNGGKYIGTAKQFDLKFLGDDTIIADNDLTEGDSGGPLYTSGKKIIGIAVAESYYLNGQPTNLFAPINDDLIAKIKLALSK